MSRQTYLVVELPGVHEAPVSFSAAHPEATLDQLITTAKEGAGVVYYVTTFAAGLAPDTIDILLADLRAAHSDVRTLRRDDDAGNWLGTHHLPADWLRDPAAVGINAFLHEHGLTPRWLRIEQGRVFAKLSVPVDVEEEPLAERLRGYMEGLGIDGEVAVEAGSAASLAPWDALADVLVEKGVTLPQSLGGPTR